MAATSKKGILHDCIQEGNIGLIVASEKFDPERGFRFGTFAIHWIKAYIAKYIMNTHSMVKIGTTNSERKMFFTLRSIRAEIDDGTLDETGIREKLANRLGQAVEKVAIMAARIDSPESSLNAPVAGGEREDNTYQDMLTYTDNPDDIIIDHIDEVTERKLFAEAVENIGLDERTMTMIKRHLDGETLNAIGKDYGLCRERVRQIEKKAVEKIRDYCSN
jgi:RNA polymerase sigma-32 factor